MERKLKTLYKQLDEIKCLNDKDYISVMGNNHQRLLDFFSGIFKVGAYIVDCHGTYTEQEGAMYKIDEVEDYFNDYAGDSEISVIFVTEHGNERKYAETLFYELLSGTIKIKE